MKIPPKYIQRLLKLNSHSTDYQLLSNSDLFDKNWYLTNYEDVAKAGVDPVRHYLNEGWQEGREPSLAFDTNYYLSQIQQLHSTLQTVKNPLVHFLTVGHSNGLLASPPDGLDGTRVTAVAKNECNDASALISVIIPIYNAIDELKACVESVIQFTYFPCRVILIDDASPDPEVGIFLSTFTTYKWVEVYRNAKNLGFSGTVNRGFTIAGDSDVVLLNADTLVSPGWLGRLKSLAYQDSEIATVTPISNNAGAFSVPEEGFNELPRGLNFEQAGRLFAQRGSAQYPSVVTGNGFCLFIKRICLDQIGFFDAEAFPKGYGEENDFCMRALKRGWKHVIDDKTWIYHERSASFGEAKKELIQAGRAIVDERYPEYTSLVKQSFSSKSILSMRARAKELYEVSIEDIDKPKVRVVYVLSTLTGGTPQTNQDLMNALSNRVETYVLHCDSRVMKLQRYSNGFSEELARIVLDEEIKPILHKNDQYDQVIRIWIKKWAIELVHIRHIAWHSLGLIDVVKSLGIPCIFSFHDFYTLCPSLKLLDENLEYCAGHCSISCGECKHELWDEGAFDRLKHNQIKPWKSKFGQYLAKCDGFVTTNNQAKSLLIEHYQQLNVENFKVIEHGRDFVDFTQLALPIKRNGPIRLLVLGNISPAKGGLLLEALAKNTSDTFIEIHILGAVSPALNLPECVFCHGVYDRENLTELISKIKPNIGLVLSIWPETWCHTLTEYWANGIPVIGSNLGAVGKRLENTNAGWVLSSLDVESLISCLKSISYDGWLSKYNNVLKWQTSVGLEQNCNKMGNAYWDFYNKVMQPLKHKV